MKTYTVSAVVTVSLFTKVNANSKQEAIEIAESRGLQGLCHQCASSREPHEEWSLSGELDGEPCDISVDND